MRKSLNSFSLAAAVDLLRSYGFEIQPPRQQSRTVAETITPDIKRSRAAKKMWARRRKQKAA